MRFLKNSPPSNLTKKFGSLLLLLPLQLSQLHAQQTANTSDNLKLKSSENLNNSLNFCTKIATSCHTIYALEGTILSGFADYSNSIIAFVSKDKPLLQQNKNNQGNLSRQKRSD